MYSIGDCVVYSNNGICRVEDIVMMNMQGDDKKYYLLIPINEKASKIYLPIDNTAGRIRMAMNKEQAMQLADSIGKIEEIHIRNDKEREAIYRDAYMSNDICKVISVLKAIFRRKAERQKNGKKSTVIDDKYFDLLKEQLYGELAYALGVEKEELEQIILKNMFRE